MVNLNTQQACRPVIQNSQRWEASPEAGVDPAAAAVNNIAGLVLSKKDIRADKVETSNEESLKATQLSTVEPNTSASSTRDLPQATVNKAIDLVQQGKYEEAVTAINQGLALNPRSKSLKAGLTTINRLVTERKTVTAAQTSFNLLELGKYEEAIAAAKAGLALNPTTESLKTHLMKIEQMAAYDQALLYGSQACELIKEEKYVEAIAAAKAGLALNPQTESLKTRLIDIEQMATSCVNNQALVYLRQAHELYKEEKYVEAIAAVNKGIALRPKDGEIFDNLYRLETLAIIKKEIKKPLDSIKESEKNSDSESSDSDSI